jgi:hypothetical protein
VKKIICPPCRYVGKPLLKKRGSTKVDIIGWCCFPLGIPYTLWRMFGKIPLCPHCKQEAIDAETAVGKRLMQKMEDNLVNSIAGSGHSSIKAAPIARPAPPPAAPVEPPPPPKPERAPRTPNTDTDW